MFLTGEIPMICTTHPESELENKEVCVEILENVVNTSGEEVDLEPAKLALDKTSPTTPPSLQMSSTTNKSPKKSVSMQMEDDFERMVITYKLKQVFIGECGIHIRPKLAKMKVILSDEERHICVVFGTGSSQQIPMSHILKLYHPEIENHYPVIRLIVSDYIAYLIHARRESLKRRQKHIENSITDKYLLKLQKNCLTFSLSPQKADCNEDHEIFCKASIKTGPDEDIFHLNAEDSVSLLQEDVQKWLSLSSMVPLNIVFQRVSIDEWQRFLTSIGMVCIQENGTWRLEPNRHILRLKGYTSSYLLNTPERLIELHPPNHKKLPLQEK